MWKLIVLLFASTAVAQSGSADAVQATTPSMTFDVASVRPVKMGPGVPYGAVFFRPFNSSHLTGTSDLRGLLQDAFAVEYYRIAGYDQISPDIRQSVYAIQARSGEDADSRLAKLPNAQRRAEQEHMYQALLIDRFQLKFHWEDRIVPGYRLVISKHMPKLSPAGSLPPDPNLAKTRVGPDMVPAVIYQHRDDRGGTLYTGRGAGLADIAFKLALPMGAPVQDATGLSGRYDFDLRLPDRTPGDSPQDNQASIIDAVQVQLGIHLGAAKIKQKVLVIDHVEPPSPN
jgi:uncharacterized protein (TIGR03435 family)